MNVYDFDNTILRGDSTVRFFRFCMRRYPALALRLPSIAWNALRYKSGRLTKTEFKQRFFAFLTHVPDVERAIGLFWEKNRCRIKSWYLAKHAEDDVVISASPEFLLRPVCDSLGIRFLLASPVDPKTGVYAGVNCDGTEKVNRYRARFGDTRIDAFYSDSLHDTPLADLASEPWLVKGDRLLPWPR